MIELIVLHKLCEKICLKKQSTHNILFQHTTIITLFRHFLFCFFFWYTFYLATTTYSKEVINNFRKCLLWVFSFHIFLLMKMSHVLLLENINFHLSNQCDNTIYSHIIQLGYNKNIIIVAYNIISIYYILKIHKNVNWLNYFQFPLSITVTNKQMFLSNSF